MQSSTFARMKWIASQCADYSRMVALQLCATSNLPFMRIVAMQAPNTQTSPDGSAQTSTSGNGSVRIPPFTQVLFRHPCSVKRHPVWINNSSGQSLSGDRLQDDSIVVLCAQIIDSDRKRTPPRLHMPACSTSVVIDRSRKRHSS